MNNLRPKRSRFSIPSDRFTRGILITFAVLGVVFAVGAFILVRNVVAGWSMTSLPGIQVKNGSTDKNATSMPAPTGPLQSSSGPTPQPWDGTSRVTILLMGLDYRDWENDGPSRTDSMWLFTVDPVSKTAGMMSIPRDTWVNVPGYGYYKINQAYFFGEADKLPGGGPALAMKTVEEFLGVPINFYAQIDFNAFVRFINKLDGIYVNVPEEIKVDPLGPGNTVILQPGRQRLMGEVALGYARNRYTEGNDFDRSKRQLQVIMAIRDRIIQPSYLPIFLGNAVGVYNEVKDGVNTNLTLQQGIQLAWLVSQIGTDKIHQAVIGPNDVIDSSSPDGLSIEIPIPDRIRLLRDQVFATGGPVGPVAVNSGNDPAVLAKAENAKIVVENGTSVEGLATRTSDYLKSLGLNITNATNADQLYSETTVIDYTGKPYTTAYLVGVMHINANRILNSYDPNAQVDVKVIAGSDWANKNDMP